MRFVLPLVLVFIIMLAGESSCEGRLGSVSSPRRRVYSNNSQHNNKTLASSNRLRSMVRKKVKRIFKTKKLSKPRFGTEMIEKLNR